MLRLSKDNSTIIKGIVIMMMLLSHLFNEARQDLFTPIFYIGNRPFISWLIRACGPIPFFLLLSGYGLAYKFETSNISPKKQFPRIVRLYIYYWVILAFFLTIGHLLKPSLYPGSFLKLFKNMLGWDVTYNSPMWFLLPYSILSLLSMYIIRLIAKAGNIWALIIAILINLTTSFFISRYGSFLYHNMTVYQPFLCFHLLVWFTVGVALRQTPLNLNKDLPQWLVAVAIITLVVVTSVLHSFLFYYLYVPLLVILLCHVKWPHCISTILAELGRKSMPIWMIHTWLSHYLFEAQVYSLKYVPFIFIALLAVSYLLSIPVMWIAERINQLVFRKG